MNVLFVTTAFPTEEAPAAGSFVLEHARAASAGAEIAVLHLDRRHGASPRLRAEFVDGEFPLWRVSYPYRPLPLSLAAHAAAAAIGYRAVRRSGFTPDLLHAHFFLAAAPTSFLAATSRTPFVATEQWTAFLPEDPLTLRRPALAAARLTLRRACAVLPVSDALRRAMEANGVRARRWEVIGNTVDVSVFHPPERPKERPSARLISVGLLNAQKGFDVLLRAFALVREQRPDATLEIVGDGPLLPELEALSRELRIEDAVEFTGLLSKPEIACRLRGSTLFVLASHFETNGVVVLEALCSGLPVVLTDTSALRELVTPENGLLAQPDDAAHMAEQIGQALAQRDAFDDQAISAHARERHGADAVGRRLLEVYEACRRR